MNILPVALKHVQLMHCLLQSSDDAHAPLNQILSLPYQSQEERGFRFSLYKEQQGFPELVRLIVVDELHK